jgi:hypothetical protein
MALEESNGKENFKEGSKTSSPAEAPDVETHAYVWLLSPARIANMYRTSNVKR